MLGTFNIFSASLQQGDQVYFVAKKIESPFQHFFNPLSTPCLSKALSLSPPYVSMEKGSNSTLAKLEL